VEFGSGGKLGADSLVAVADAPSESLGKRGESSEEDRRRQHAHTRTPAPHKIPFIVASEGPRV
jgi:hypothetical protein